jgi:hypothetical protein
VRPKGAFAATFKMGHSGNLPACTAEGGRVLV